MCKARGITFWATRYYHVVMDTTRAGSRKSWWNHPWVAVQASVARRMLSRPTSSHLQPPGWVHARAQVIGSQIAMVASPCAPLPCVSWYHAKSQWNRPWMASKASMACHMSKAASRIRGIPRYTSADLSGNESICLGLHRALRHLLLG